ncbi:MAG: hypothetical protein AWU57_44 [Marinobacter sp. T13-3]|nr:MAG: hypothetical protein AWU57_44 [Marinobacter sp. T13-3]
MTATATSIPARHSGLMDSQIGIANLDSSELAGIANIAALFIGANLDRSKPVMPGFSFAEAIREIRSMRSANVDAYWRLLNASAVNEMHGLGGDKIYRDAAEGNSLDLTLEDYYESDYVAFERDLKRSLREEGSSRHLDDILYDNFLLYCTADSPCPYLRKRYAELTQELVRDCVYLYADLVAEISVRDETLVDAPDMQTVFFYLAGEGCAKDIGLSHQFAWPEVIFDVTGRDAESLREDEGGVLPSRQPSLPPAIDRIFPCPSGAGRTRLYGLFLAMLRGVNDSDLPREAAYFDTFVRQVLIPRLEASFSDVEGEPGNVLQEIVSVLVHEVPAGEQRAHSGEV